MTSRKPRRRYTDSPIALDWRYARSAPAAKPCAATATTVLGRCRDVEDPHVIVDDVACCRGHVAAFHAAEEHFESPQSCDLEHVQRCQKICRHAESFCREGQCLSEPVRGFDADDLELRRRGSLEVIGVRHHSGLMRAAAVTPSSRAAPSTAGVTPLRVRTPDAIPCASTSASASASALAAESSSGQTPLNSGSGSVGKVRNT